MSSFDIEVSNDLFSCFFFKRKMIVLHNYKLLGDQI